MAGPRVPRHDRDRVDLQLLDDREVDTLVARTIAHCEQTGIAPPSPERARQLIAEFDAFLAGTLDLPTKPH